MVCQNAQFIERALLHGRSYLALVASTLDALN
jgi:hypothetical protein